MINIENVEYAKAFTEVLEILKYVPIQEKEKIPKEIVTIMEENKDKNYFYSIDSLHFEKQEMMPITEAILEDIYQKYWISEGEKRKIREEERKEQWEKERKKQEEFNGIEDTWRKRRKSQIPTKQGMVVYQEKFFQNLLTKIKEFIKKQMQR